MKNFTNFLTSLIFAGWIGVIAIISMQNIEPITLKFLWFQSIELTTGLLLAFSLGIGLLLGSIFFSSNSNNRKNFNQKKAKFNRPRREDFERKNKRNDKEDWSQKPSQDW